MASNFVFAKSAGGF